MHYFTRKLELISEILWVIVPFLLSTLNIFAYCLQSLKGPNNISQTFWGMLFIQQWPMFRHLVSYNAWSAKVWPWQNNKFHWCYIRVTIQISLIYNLLCLSIAVEIRYCEGRCGSMSDYHDEYPFFKVICTCCLAKEQTIIPVILKCPGNDNDKVVTRNNVLSCRCERCNNKR